MDDKENKFIELFKNTMQKELPAYLEKHSSEFKDDTIRVLDIGCFPWHGYMEFSFLTTNESFLEEKYGKYAIGDWRLYCFNYNLVGDVESFTYITDEMNSIWERTENKYEFTEALLLACAEVARSEQLMAAFKKYSVTEDFELTVFHGDDSDKENYCHRIS
jgi:hypothetical protein